VTAHPGEVGHLLRVAAELVCHPYQRVPAQRLHTGYAARMKSIAFALLLVATVASADEVVCPLPLSRGTTHELIDRELNRCNRTVRRTVCRRFCKDQTLAPDLCTACRDSFAGPCGVHVPTTVECCGSGFPVYIIGNGGAMQNICPTTACLRDGAGAAR
jgi:hypothetical protein